MGEPLGDALDYRDALCNPNVKRMGWGPPYGLSGPHEPRKRVQRGPIPSTFDYLEVFDTFRNFYQRLSNLIRMNHFLIREVINGFRDTKKQKRGYLYRFVN